MPYSYDRRTARRHPHPRDWDMEDEEALVESMMDDFTAALPKFIQKGLKVKRLDRKDTVEDATVFMEAEYESKDPWFALEVRVEQRSWIDADEDGYHGGTDEPEISWSYDDGDAGDYAEIEGETFLPTLRQHVQQIERKLKSEHPDLGW